MSKTIDYLKLADELLLSHSYLDENRHVQSQINPTIDQYLSILNDGLTGQTTTPKTIAVVGAGIAGMLCAKLLQEYGHTVILVEANERVGGRIKTFHTTDNANPAFADPNQYGEAGAMRFPEIHPLIMAYFDKYNLEKQPFYLTDVTRQSQLANENPGDKVNNAWIRCNSIQMRKKQYNVDQSDDRVTMNQGFLTNDEQSASQLLDEAYEPVRDLYSDIVTAVDPNTGEEYQTRVDKPYEQWRAGWAEVIERYDEFTVRRYLNEVANLTESQMDLIGTIENLTSRMPLAFMHSFLGRSDINPNNVYHEIKGGSWNITQALFEDIKNKVDFRPNHRIANLDFDNGAKGIGKWAKNGNSTVSISSFNEDGQQNPAILADLAVITIPFSSFRFVRTDPDFSYHKRRAVIELHYDAATKVLLEFSKRWWEFTTEEWQQEIENLGQEYSAQTKASYLAELDLPLTEATNVHGGGSVTDNPNRFMYYPSHPVDGSEGGVILASYTWADDARRWDSMNDEDRYAFALRGMKLVHGDRIEPYFTGKAKTQSWARSPYAFGEAAVFQAGQFTNLHLSTQTVEGPVHFAGEHTSMKHAWAEGSLESAIRVALEIQALG